MPMSRKTLLREISGAVELRGEIFGRINAAPVGVLKSEWLADQLDTLALVERTLDELVGRLAAAK